MTVPPFAKVNEVSLFLLLDNRTVETVLTASERG